MRNGKHTSSAKRFSNSNDYSHKTINTTKKKKTFLIAVAISIVIILIFLGYIHFRNHPIFLFSYNAITNTVDDEVETYEKYVEKLGEASEKVKSTRSVTVKGAEYLEITGIHVNSDNPKLSTISAKLKNLSDIPRYNVDIRITLFDKNSKEITFLDYKIDTIEPRGEASTYAALKRDLSNCKSYTIALKKAK